MSEEHSIPDIRSLLRQFADIKANNSRFDFQYLDHWHDFVYAVAVFYIDAEIDCGTLLEQVIAASDYSPADLSQELKRFEPHLAMVYRNGAFTIGAAHNAILMAANYDGPGHQIQYEPTQSRMLHLLGKDLLPFINEMVIFGEHQDRLFESYPRLSGAAKVRQYFKNCLIPYHIPSERMQYYLQRLTEILGTQQTVVFFRSEDNQAIPKAVGQLLQHPQFAGQPVHLIDANDHLGHHYLTEAAKQYARRVSLPLVFSAGKFVGGLKEFR